MKLHRDLRIAQKSAWHLAHRIRETWQDSQEPFEGLVEVAESYFGGLEKDKHVRKRLKAGKGTVGKTPVVGVKDRASGKTSMKVVENPKKGTLQGFIARNIRQGAEVDTDVHKSYERMAATGTRQSLLALPSS